MDMKPVLAILPPKLRESTEGLRTGALEELRLRAGRPPTAVLDGKERILPGCAEAVTSRMLEEIVSAATNRSCYSAEASLREGYVTLPGGHRVGLCGTAALRESRIQSLRELSSVSIRIARQVSCAPPEAAGCLNTDLRPARLWKDDAAARMRPQPLRRRQPRRAGR